MPLANVTLGPAIPDPGAIYTVGLNYDGPGASPRPERPLIYGKAAASEYEAAGRAMRERTVKLREMRLAKEAADREAEAAKPKPAAKAKAAVKGKKKGE